MKIVSNVAIIVIAVGAMTINAQKTDPFNAGRTTGISKIGQPNPFNSERAGNFNDYRISLNAEYARQIKEYEWRQHQMKNGDLPPDRNIIPVSPISWQNNREKNRNDKEVIIEEIVVPIKGNNAQPIAPIIVPDGEDISTNLTLNFLGTNITLQAPVTKFSLSGISREEISKAWMRLSQPEYSLLVADCLKQKQRLRLCDWATMLFFESVAKTITSDADAETVLMTYLASQAGYNVRLATTAENKLDMMYASQHRIYDRPYIVADNSNYFPYFSKSKSYLLCNSHFKNETGLSLWITQLPHVNNDISENRTISSSRYPDFKLTSSVNKNLISFYSTYPTSSIGSNPVSRWAMYANTPISDHVKQRLYPQLRSLIANKNPLEGVERILNWIQTGFVYEYDDKVWGGDRAFFPEESLYYPYCDCEDRSILLTRLVRDLLGLDCLLVFYPGHLAAAINFPSEVKGDYILLNGKKFTITDPTYIGAPVGITMPDMDNSTAKVILLD